MDKNSKINIIANYYNDCIIVNDKEAYKKALKLYIVSNARHKDNFFNSECRLIRALNDDDLRKQVAGNPLFKLDDEPKSKVRR